MGEQMSAGVILKERALAVACGMPDYDRQRASFTWAGARRRLDGLAAGGLNIAFEAVDRHVLHGKGSVVALRFLAEDGRHRDLTYEGLARETSKFANVLE